MVFDTPVGGPAVSPPVGGPAVSPSGQARHKEQNSGEESFSYSYAAFPTTSHKSHITAVMTAPVQDEAVYSRCKSSGTVRPDQSESANLSMSRGTRLNIGVVSETWILFFETAVLWGNCRLEMRMAANLLPHFVILGLVV